MSRLVHAGSAVVDLVYRIDALPRAGSEVVSRAHDRLAGGGFNMMSAARRAGLDVAFAGGHGVGPDGDFLRQALAREGIEIVLPVRGDLDSGHCVVLVTADAERTFVSWPGAEGLIEEGELAAIALRPGDWVFSSGYPLSYPRSREALAAWIGSLPDFCPFVFDPTPVIGDVPPHVLTAILRRVDWLSCNGEEARAIAERDGDEVNARRLLELCPRAGGVLVRSGADGALLLTRDGTCRRLAAFAVDAVDTNGAGDTHVGAFVAALAAGRPAEEALAYAQAAAAIAVTRHGGASAPTDREIRGFLRAREEAAGRPIWAFDAEPA